MHSMVSLAHMVRKLVVGFFIFELASELVMFYFTKWSNLGMRKALPKGPKAPVLLLG